MNQKNRAREILGRLRATYSEPGPFVRWSNPLELVVGTVLSAQCTDCLLYTSVSDLRKTRRIEKRSARLISPRLRSDSVAIAADLRP